MKRLSVLLSILSIFSTTWAQAPSSVEAVDMGFPSGTLWASCNIGATNPEDFGDYFAWGETEKKDKYNLDTYTLRIKSTDSDGFEVYSYVDVGDDISGTEYDAANVKWGNGWRMPTSNEIQELHDYCEWEYSKKNGVIGYKLTSKINSSYIFLPESYIIFGTTKNTGRGQYWSSTQTTMNGESTRALSLYFSKSNICTKNFECWYGVTIRPVRSTSLSTNIEKCATPTITFSNGKLEFHSDTKDAKFYYTIKDKDIGSGYCANGESIKLVVTYQITVYAYADGYKNSEEAKATLSWIDYDPKIDRITSLTRLESKPILVKSLGNTIIVEGDEIDEDVEFYGINGQYLGSEKMVDGQASFDTNLDMLIVKVGEKSIKIKK